MSRVIDIWNDNGTGTTLFDYEWNDLRGIGGATGLQGDRTLVGNATLTMSTTEIATLSCDVYPQMELANGQTARDFLAGCTPYRSHLNAYLTRGAGSSFDLQNDTTFSGRIMEISKQMDADGVYFYRITAEGMEAQLLDVPFDNSSWLDPTAGNVDEYGYVDSGDYMEWLIAIYNASDAVQDGDLYALNTRAAALNRDPIMIHRPYKPSMTASGVILDEMRNIVEKCGGGLAFTHIDDNGSLGPSCLHVTWDESDMLQLMFGSLVPIDATLGESLESCAVKRNYADIVNRVRVVGSTYTEKTPVENNNNNEEEQEYLTSTYYVSGVCYLNALDQQQIADLFDGSDIDYEVSEYNELFVFNPESVNAYGAITRGMQITGYDDGAEMTEDESTGATTFDHIDIDSDRAERFMAEAIDYIREHSEPDVSIDADIVDPCVTSPDSGLVPHIYGDVHIDNELVDIDETHTICAVTYDMCDPIRDRIDIGTKRKDTGASVLARAANGVKKLEESKLDATPATKSRLGGIKLPEDGSIWGEDDGTIHAATGGGGASIPIQYLGRAYGNVNNKNVSGWDYARQALYSKGDSYQAYAPRLLLRSAGHISDSSNNVAEYGITVPARSAIEATFVFYYAFAAFYTSFCSLNGRLFDGLMTHPCKFFDQIYKPTVQAAQNGTLTWSMVERYYENGIISIAPYVYSGGAKFNRAQQWQPPFIVTDITTRRPYKNAVACDSIYSWAGSNGVDPPLVTQVVAWEIQHEYIAIVTHPTLGKVRLSWPVIAVTLRFTNYNTADHSVITANTCPAVTLNGFRTGTKPEPEGASTTGTAGTPTWNRVFDDPSWWENSGTGYNPEDATAMDYWGVCAYVGGDIITGTNGQSATEPVEEIGVNIDDGSVVQQRQYIHNYKPIVTV